MPFVIALSLVAGILCLISAIDKEKEGRYGSGLIMSLFAVVNFGFAIFNTVNMINNFSHQECSANATQSK